MSAKQTPRQANIPNVAKMRAMSALQKCTSTNALPTPFHDCFPKRNGVSKTGRSQTEFGNEGIQSLYGRTLPLRNRQCPFCQNSPIAATPLRSPAACALSGPLGRLAAAERPIGRVEGHLEGAKAGQEILAAGGNAVDAGVAAALVASVVSPYHVGPGGYGGSMIISTADGAKVVGIDFNTVAPAAARPDMFRAKTSGPAKDPASMFGWKAVGVPGVLAGLQHALDRFGTKKFADVVAPAIRYARDGFPTTSLIASSIRSDRKRLAADPGSAKLLLPGGEPPKVGSPFKNPDLAAMLETLAQRGSVESFYNGDIAAKIATAIRAGGGLVTEADLAAYRAHEVLAGPAHLERSHRLHAAADRWAGRPPSKPWPS